MISLALIEFPHHTSWKPDTISNEYLHRFPSLNLAAHQLLIHNACIHQPVAGFVVVVGRAGLRVSVQGSLSLSGDYRSCVGHLSYKIFHQLKIWVSLALCQCLVLLKIISSFLDWMPPIYRFCRFGTFKARLLIPSCHFTSLTQSGFIDFLY